MLGIIRPIAVVASCLVILIAGSSFLSAVGIQELLLLLIGLAFYFIPAFIARGRKNSVSIAVVNLLLGWTGIGWICVLIWAIVSPKILKH